MSKYLMTIDAGTGSARAVIFDVDGNQISVGQEEWEHLSLDGVKNSMSFDYENNWDLILRCISKALSDVSISAEEIIAVSATSMREGIVLYDKDNKEIFAVANVDARADKEVRFLKDNFEGIEQEFYELSGQTFALGALPRILWVKENLPDTYEKVSKISMISDWILFKLSGVIATDPSNGGTSGVYSLKERDWIPEMATRVGLKDDIFPPSFEPGVVLGKVNSNENILSTNTLVVVGGGDVQLGSAGLGVVNKGDVAILGGSFWQQIVNISSDDLPPKDMSIRVNPHVIKGQSQAEGITFFSGLVMRWFRDAFCEYEKVLAEKKGIDIYAYLEEIASHVPAGSYDIMPIFSDSMKYGKWYHAAPSFLNLSLDASKCNKASMFRSLQENACIVSAINLEKIEAFTGVNCDEIIFAAGASKGFLWPQILADVTGKKVKIPRVKEATALGGAMAAGVGAGIYSSLKEAAEKLVVWEKEFYPNMDNHKVYSDLRVKWEKAYDAQLKLVDENITTSMWQAPGL
ncbi:MAG: autoinducer-2 kinase [Campylobacteraceae bacterium]|nr:autoinducer-2 kinase [Campylobacteraceae bacterium]